jgi:hypothetical protein
VPLPLGATCQMPAIRRPHSPLFVVAGYMALALAGFAAGMLLAFPLRENAVNVVVLGAGIALSWRLARVALPAASRPLVPAVAVQGGHVVWLLFGLLVLGRWLGLADVVALLAGLYWLGRRPERWPAIYLVAVHSLAALVLLADVAQSQEPAEVFPIFLAHAALRALGVFLTLRGLNAIWRRARRPVPRLA